MSRNLAFDAISEEYGIYFPFEAEDDLRAFDSDDAYANYLFEMAHGRIVTRTNGPRYVYDAQPTLITTPSAGIPALLATIVDPNILRILTAKNAATNIIEEVRRGDWAMDTAIFPIVESTGVVSSYGDFNENGVANVNTNWPARQNYLWQTIQIYGDRELARAELARLNWASEVRFSAVTVLDKFMNLVYFKGVQGLQNYGLQTDPGLPPPIGPAPKANGGFQWLSGNAPNASANEIYSDIQVVINQLISQSAGRINADSEIVLAMSPARRGAITATNSFGVNVTKLINENYKRLRIEDAVQYGLLTPQNSQGVAAGEMMQAICPNVDGQQTAWAAFSEKLRAHPVVRGVSNLKQKMTSGAWGAIIRQPFAVATMIGI